MNKNIEDTPLAGPDSAPFEEPSIEDYYMAKGREVPSLARRFGRQVMIGVSCVTMPLTSVAATFTIENHEAVRTGLGYFADGDMAIPSTPNCNADIIIEQNENPSTTEHTHDEADHTEDDEAGEENGTEDTPDHNPIEHTKSSAHNNEYAVSEISPTLNILEAVSEQEPFSRYTSSRLGINYEFYNYSMSDEDAPYWRNIVPTGIEEIETKLFDFEAYPEDANPILVESMRCNYAEHMRLNQAGDYLTVRILVPDAPACTGDAAVRVDDCKQAGATVPEFDVSFLGFDIAKSPGFIILTTGGSDVGNSVGTISGSLFGHELTHLFAMRVDESYQFKLDPEEIYAHNVEVQLLDPQLSERVPPVVSYAQLDAQE